MKNKLVKFMEAYEAIMKGKEVTIGFSLLFLLMIAIVL